MVPGMSDNLPPVSPKRPQPSEGSPWNEDAPGSPAMKRPEPIHSSMPPEVQPTRGGGNRLGSAAMGAAKAKMAGTSVAKGAAAGASGGEKLSGGDQVAADAKSVLKTAAAGAAAGGSIGGAGGAAAGAVKGAVKGALKTKTGKRILSAVVMAFLLVVVIVINLITPSGSTSAAIVTGSNSIAEGKAVAEVIDDPDVAQALKSAAAANNVPYAAMAAIYEVQNSNSRNTGPLGIDLDAVDGEIDKDGAEDIDTAADFIADLLNSALRDAMMGSSSSGLDVGLLEGVDAEGNRVRVESTSESAKEARAESKANWLIALKALPLTTISKSAESMFDLATGWSAGQACLPTKHEESSQTSVGVQTAFTSTPTTTKYAQAIIQQAADMGLPEQAAVIAIMTALQESKLQIWWNIRIPASEALAPDKAFKGRDGYSVGLFQQQVNGTNYSWGTIEDAMDPAISAKMFYTALTKVPEWETLPYGTAAQKVQVSAHPKLYNQWQEVSEKIVADNPAGEAGSTAGSPTADGCAPEGENQTGGGVLSVDGEWIWPVAGGTPTAFAWRFSPTMFRWMVHQGSDIAVPTGTPIYAMSAGTVTFSGWNGGYGNHVRILHADGVGSSYSHIVNGGLVVKTGEQVEAGQLIAKVGTTGGSTGPHLHFEVYLNGLAIDPLAFFAGRVITVADLGPLNTSLW